MLARVGRFPKIPFLHFTLFCATSLCNSRSLMSFPTHSFHVFLPLPLGLLPSTTTFLHSDTQSPCSFLSTCPNHLSLARLTNSEILSMFKRPLNSSVGTLSLNDTLHIHLIIILSVLSSLFISSVFIGQVSLP